MRRTVISLALASLAGAAAAQSSVTIFGVIDATLAFGRATGPGSADRTQLTNSGLNSSRLGFRGREDLGGGSYASFWLEAGVINDDGRGAASNTNNQASGGPPAGVNGGQGLSFNRRSFVTYGGNWGEIRLGREYTPQFWTHILFDPFGGVGVGTTQTFTSIITGITTGTAVRASNSMTYLLPQGLGGFYGHAMYYLGENPKNGAANEDDGTGAGIRVGFAKGPFDIALAVSRTDYATGDTRQNNLGASYDFGVAKLMTIVGRDKIGALRGKSALIGAVIPLGAHEIHTSYSTYRTSAAGTPRSDKVAIGYQYNLSKRTAVYTTYAALRNRGGAAQALNGSVVGAGGNQRSTGLDIGLRHAF